MNLIDILDLYSWEHDSDDLMLMLQDYLLDERLDREELNMAIIARHGAMRCISNNTTVMKTLFEEFFKRYSWNIARLIDTLELDYNPIENYKIHKDYSEEEHRESDADVVNTDTINRTQILGSVTENKVSAYDASSYQPKDSTDVDESQSVIANNGGTSDIDSTTDTTNTQVTDEHGKIGETSYQDLINKERQVAEFNVYNWILDTMKTELFILVY